MCLRSLSFSHTHFTTLPHGCEKIFVDKNVPITITRKTQFHLLFKYRAAKIRCCVCRGQTYSLETKWPLRSRQYFRLFLSPSRQHFQAMKASQKVNEKKYGLRVNPRERICYKVQSKFSLLGNDHYKDEHIIYCTASLHF